MIIADNCCDRGIKWQAEKILNYKTPAKLMADHMVALAAMHFKVESARSINQSNLKSLRILLW